jgi:hypothetical protein
MASSPTKKAIKLAEDSAYAVRVQTALAAAHEAAKKAAAAFIAKAPKTPEGFVRDACGNATVVIFKPSYRFRKTLDRLGEIRPGYGGAWTVSNFTREVREQSVQAAEAAAHAARVVLEHEFPEEPQFFDQSHLT